MFQQSLTEGLFRLKHGMSLNIASQSRTLADLATPTYCELFTQLSSSANQSLPSILPLLLTQQLSSVFVSNYRGQYHALVKSTYKSAEVMKKWIQIRNPLNTQIPYSSDHSEEQIVYSPGKKWLHVCSVPPLTNNATQLH